MIYADKKIEEIKDRLTAIYEGIDSIKESTAMLLQLSKETSTDIGKVRLSFNGFKQEGAKFFNIMFSQVDSINSKSSSSPMSLQSLFRTHTPYAPKVLRNPMIVCALTCTTLLAIFWPKDDELLYHINKGFCHFSYYRLYKDTAYS